MEPGGADVFDFITMYIAMHVACLSMLYDCSIKISVYSHTFIPQIKRVDLKNPRGLIIGN